MDAAIPSDISEAVKLAGNVLEVDIVNGWWNQLAGDPKHERTRTNIRLKPGDPKHERTRTNIRLKPGAQPQESGLLGPVTIQSGERKTAPSPVAAEKTDYRFGIGWMQLPPYSAERTAAIEIEQAIYRYTYAIDTRDWDYLAGLFTLDGTVDLNGWGPKQAKMTVKEWYANAYNGVDTTPTKAVLYSRHNVPAASLRHQRQYSQGLQRPLRRTVAS